MAGFVHTPQIFIKNGSRLFFAMQAMMRLCAHGPPEKTVEFLSINLYNTLLQPQSLAAFLLRSRILLTADSCR